MSDLRLSPLTRQLLKAAKSDGPTAATRAKVWAGVSGAVGSAAATGGGTAATGGLTVAKMLAAGTLLGGSFTVGLALTMLQVGPTPTLPGGEALGNAHASVVMPGGRIHAAAAPLGATPATITMPPTMSKTRPATNVASGAAAASAPLAKSATRSLPQPRLHEDALGHEASLIVQARAALARGDADAAFRTINSAQTLSHRQLIPEELTVKSQALRALGRGQDADEVDATLRANYPESALAR